MKILRAAVLFSAALTIFTGTALRAQGLFEQTELFVGGQDNYNTYRIPSLICTGKGTVLGFTEGRRDVGQDGGPTDIVLNAALETQANGRRPSRRLRAGDATAAPR